MKYRVIYIWNIICIFVFIFIAAYDITSGRTWQSLIWFFYSFITVVSCFFFQNEEKIEKLNEIKELLKNKKE